MHLGEKLKGTCIRTNKRLTRLDDQPLGKAALVIVLFLDIFILVSIFNGLYQHTRQLASPDEYIPNSCREMVINRQWNPTNRTDNLSHIIITTSNSANRIEEKKKELHPECVPYSDLLDQIKNDRVLINVFQDRNTVEREAKELQRAIDNLKGAYDTSLLETIAKQGGQTKVGATREDFLQKTGSLDILKTRLAATEQTINNHAKIQLLWERLQSLQEQDRQRLLTDLRTLNFWFPVKKLGMQLLFLLPLLLVFYCWNSTSIKRNWGLQTLVSSHLMTVSFIPVLCKTIETVYDVIPRKLLKSLIDLLESLKLVAIWHYLIIALAIVAAVFLIYIFQKKLFSREKLIERRIAKGECQHCGKRLPAGAQACPFCGSAQFTACLSCNKPRHVHGKYCQQCGSASAE